MKLTPEQIRQFREAGYVAVPDFWNERETHAMQAEVGRLKREGLLRNVATAGDGQTESTTAQNLQICPIYTKSDFFAPCRSIPKW